MKSQNADSIDLSTPHVHLAIIGGTGLADQLFGGTVDDDTGGGFAEHAESTCPDTPFGKPSGVIRTGVLPSDPLRTKISLLARHGAGHLLNPSRVPYRANIFALKELGVTHLIASGAVGSLREKFRPGSVALVDQFIDKTVGRASTFFEKAAVHVEFSQPCCPVMGRWLLGAAGKLEDIECHERATYVCMEGPAFSTRAESEMHRGWGGDLIGMTALPEAKLAREAEIAYALIALPTDYDAWRQPADEDRTHASLLEEIIGNLNRATSACVQLIRKALTDVSPLAAERSPASDALGLAIWSEKSKIEEEEISRLGVLWGRYF